MAFTVISAKYPPQIDPTRVPLAYGDRALPKLNRELQVGRGVSGEEGTKNVCAINQTASWSEF